MSERIIRTPKCHLFNCLDPSRLAKIVIYLVPAEIVVFSAFYAWYSAQMLVGKMM